MMSTARCNQEIYDHGHTVFLTHTISSVLMEEWTQAVAKESDQNVDWHWGCGRAEMLAVGDLNRVRKAIIKLAHMHDDAYTEAVQELGDLFSEKDIKAQLAGIWEHNRREYGLFRNICSKCPGECRPQNHAGWDPTQEGHG